MVAPQASCLSCLHLLGHPIPGVTRCAQPPSLPWLLPGAWFCCLQLYFDRLPDSFPNHSFSWSSILRCSYCRFPAIPPLPFWNLCHPQADEKFLKKKNCSSGLPWRSSGSEPALQCRECGFDFWLGNQDPTYRGGNQAHVPKLQDLHATTKDPTCQN